MLFVESHQRIFKNKQNSELAAPSYSMATSVGWRKARVKLQASFPDTHTHNLPGAGDQRQPLLVEFGLRRLHGDWLASRVLGAGSARCIPVRARMRVPASAPRHASALGAGGPGPCFRARVGHHQARARQFQRLDAGSKEGLKSVWVAGVRGDACG